MNSIRQIQALNKRELEAGVSTSTSWHNDYRDTAFVYVGGLPFELTEGDIVTILSQFGKPVYVNLVRDKDTGKSRGFAFVKYEDQRSTDLAVDNLGGATLLGRVLKVDHTRYKRKEDEETRDNTNGVSGDNANVEIIDKPTNNVGSPKDVVEERPILQEERELADIIENHDENDPMKEYLIQQKREELDAALAAVKKRKGRHSDAKSRSHRHRHSRLERRRSDDNVKKSESAPKSSKNGRPRSESLLSDQDPDEARHRRRQHQTVLEPMSGARKIKRDRSAEIYHRR